MELKRYLLTVWRWWWLVSVAMITVIISTIVFTYTITPEYKSEARLIVKPSTITADEERASLSTLSKPFVINTYAEVAQSPSIIQAAWDQLGIPPAHRKGFAIRGTILQNTNIVIITASGPDPTLVQNLATAVSQMTVTYVAGLYEIYDLKMLDQAPLPLSPISPNRKLNLILGVVIGLGFGVICAFLADYLATPLDRTAQISIVDVQTGAYKSSYFLRRLREEISRAKRVQRPFVISLIRLENFDEIISDFPPGSRQLLLKQVVHSLNQTLSEENLVAQWHGDTLALLMPDCDLKIAQQTVERLRAKLAWTAFEIDDSGLRINFTPSFGLAEYDLNGTGPERLLELAEKNIQREMEPPNSYTKLNLGPNQKKTPELRTDP